MSLDPNLLPGDVRRRADWTGTCRLERGILARQRLDQVKLRRALPDVPGGAGTGPGFALGHT